MTALLLPPRRLTTPATPCASAEAERAALRHVRSQTAVQRSMLRQKYLDAASADGAGGAKSTGVRWWLKFMVFGRNSSPFTRLTANSPLELKLEAEQMILDFAIWLATCSPSGQQISTRTVMKYVSQVRAWHLRTQGTHLCGDLDYARVRDVVRGIERLVPQPAKRQRWGVRTQDLAEAMHRFLDDTSAHDTMWRAALSVAFCGLLRGAEFALQKGETFDTLRHLTRADVQFRVATDGSEYVVLRMRPAKQRGATKSVPLLLGGGGSIIDPVRALRMMFEADPVAKELEASTPLFRRHGLPITVPQVRAAVKQLMAKIGLDARRFGAHSLRIGGATAALAANMSPAAIRAAGRWSSDVYVLYTRASRRAALGVSTIIGSTPFEDIERGVQFCDEELLLTAGEMPAQRVESFVEQELIDDALADEDEA